MPRRVFRIASPRTRASPAAVSPPADRGACNRGAAGGAARHIDRNHRSPRRSRAVLALARERLMCLALRRTAWTFAARGRRRDLGGAMSGNCTYRDHAEPAPDTALREPPHASVAADAVSREIGRHLALDGYAVITGCGPGV